MDTRYLQSRRLVNVVARRAVNTRQARYLRDLQPFVGSMTLAYRKGALNEAGMLWDHSPSSKTSGI
jgi:hypothetical protein